MCSLNYIYVQYIVSAYYILLREQVASSSQVFLLTLLFLHVNAHSLDNAKTTLVERIYI